MVYYGTMKIPSPLTAKTFEHMAGKWIKVINRQESASIINLSKRSQVYRVNQFLNDRSFLKKRLKNYSQTQFIPIFSPALLIEEDGDFQSFIEKKLKKDKKRFVFIIINADGLLSENRELLVYLNSLRTKNLSVSLLYFFQKNFTLPQYNPQKLSAFSSLFENIIIVPLFESYDIDQFIAFAKSYFKISLPESVAQKIKDNCGSRFWLVLEAIRHYADAKEENNLFDHEQMQLKLKIIWDDYDDIEKTILEKIVRGNFEFLKNEKPTLDYLLKIRLIEKKDKFYSITIPIVASYIKKQLNGKTKIEINEREQIIINDVVSDSFFSKQEKRLIKFLLKNQEKVIKRDEAASILWKEASQDNYTDWALDQAVYRLRLKFNQLGLDSNMIATKKNQGFIFKK